jgi:tyrosyl-DNA phosphodiesterase-1
MKAVRDANARAGPHRTVSIECQVCRLFWWILILLDLQGSSIGTYSSAWLNEFYHSALGESAEDWLDKSKAQRNKLSFPGIKIVFPTLKFIQESAGGELVSWFLDVYLLLPEGLII